MAAAAAGRSPLSNSTATPAASSCRMASAAPGRRASSSTIQPSISASSTSSKDRPAPGGGAGAGKPKHPAAKSGVPKARRRPARVPVTPCPTTVRCASTGGTGTTAAKARAMGWDDPRSRAAARASRPSGPVSARGITALTVILPRVRVPVLSNTQRSTRARVSSTWPRRIRKPRRRNSALATVRAVGVARERAQGQVTTSTERVTHRAREGSIHHQVAATSADTTSTAATKPLATRSAWVAIRGFSPWALATRSRMAPSRVCCPVLATRIPRGLSPLTVPALTALPGPFTTGLCSPVSTASITAP